MAVVAFSSFALIVESCYQHSIEFMESSMLDSSQEPSQTSWKTSNLIFKNNITLTNADWHDTGFDKNHTIKSLITVTRSMIKEYNKIIKDKHARSTKFKTCLYDNNERHRNIHKINKSFEQCDLSDSEMIVT